MPNSELIGWLCYYLAQKGGANDWKKYIKNQLRCIIINAFCFFRGLNEYNEPAQALMNKD